MDDFDLGDLLDTAYDDYLQTEDTELTIDEKTCIFSSLQPRACW